MRTFTTTDGLALELDEDDVPGGIPLKLDVASPLRA